MTGTRIPPVPCTDGADTLFTNGTIYVDLGYMRGAAPRAETALAVKDGRVAAVGEAATELAGPHTAVVDLQGACVFPGWNDNHIHVTATNYITRQGVMLATPDGGPADTMDAVCGLVAAFAAKHPDKACILGNGWDMPLDRAVGTALDAVVPDKVVWLMDKHGHAALTNSAGLRLAAIDARTPDPTGGTIYKDASGQPNGLLGENAMGLVGGRLAYGYREVSDGLQENLDHLASLGLTGFTDIVGAPGNLSFAHPDYYPQVFTDMETRGTLPLRVFYHVPVFGLGDVDVARRFMDDPSKNTELVSCVGGKLWVDGAFFDGNAWTRFEHLNRAGYHGACNHTPDELAAIVGRACEIGLPMQYHATGDQAIDAIVSALEAHGSGGLRHVMVHGSMIDEELVRRMIAIGMPVAAQYNFWGFMREAPNAVAAYGREAFEASFDFGRWLDLGLPISASTDLPACLTYRPIENMAYGFDPPFGGRSLSAGELLGGYSAGTAFALSAERDLGRLVPGYKADMVVVDGDAAAITTAEAFRRLRVLQTWVGGVRRH